MGGLLDYGPAVAGEEKLFLQSLSDPNTSARRPGDSQAICFLWYFTFTTLLSPRHPFEGHLSVLWRGIAFPAKISRPEAIHGFNSDPLDHGNPASRF